MPIIVDSNTISRVFNVKNKEHAPYRPVLDWILRGEGIVVVGGDEYMKELSKTAFLMRYLRVLKEARKVVFVTNEKVQLELDRISTIGIPDDFNDPHICALVNASKVGLVCTYDVSSCKYVGNSMYYKNMHPPKFFTGREKNRELLSMKYVPKCWNDKVFKLSDRLAQSLFEKIETI